MTSSLFAVPKMDCPAEERLIRMALEQVPGVGVLDFDLDRRELRVAHAGSVEPIASRLASLGLGARLLSSTQPAAVTPAAARASSAPLSEPTSLSESASTPAPASTGSATITGDTGSRPSSADEARVLWLLLAINAAMFVIELAMGWAAQSTGLIADSLDMFADAAVYGLSLYAVGQAARHRARAARLSGLFQVLLAFGALFEVLRRFVAGSDPEPPLMMGIGLLALAANATCVALLSRHREGGVHMKASWIFSTNDVLANAGVIVAGALVAWSGSNLPDLIIGTVIAVFVLNGARRILRLSN